MLRLFMMKRFLKSFVIYVLYCIPAVLFAQGNITLENDSLLLEWKNTVNGFQLTKVLIKGENHPISLANTSGKYAVIYTDQEIDMKPDWSQFDENVRNFPDKSYFLIYNKWHESLSPVAMNTAGTSTDFFPHKAYKKDNKLVFEHTIAEGVIRSIWQFDPKYNNDIVVEVEFEAKKAGYFSLATPILMTFEEKELEWGMIPGHFQGARLNHNLVQSFAYGQGIPDRPVVVRERTATTLSPLIHTKSGVTLAVIPSPGTGRDPWADSVSTHWDWKLGLSLMTRDKQLSPVAYHPVLGQKGSFMKAGEVRQLNFRYTLKQGDWYDVYRHAIYDIYQFGDFLAKKETKKSLTDRVWGMFDYVRKGSTSLWHTYAYKGLEIGAQEYNGPILGSNKDAVKNADYGAMWMLASLTNDNILLEDRLPYARNFKIAQQESEKEFFKGSVSGQYYLWKSKRFTEEWGDYAEPIALTYYVMLDMANILLFEPNDEELRKRLEMGADRLLAWQKPDGSWPVAYDHKTGTEMFEDIQDLRPTFYGLLVAYKILKEEKYLEAARKGAEWFIKNATDEGHFLGVCGDFRFAPDFATGQSAQALLDLYDVTGDSHYLDAAIRTSRIYTASVYTHPIPSNSPRHVNGKLMKEWEISQVGLSFEHGGTIGSATRVQGPILLASHAGMFVRLFKLTGDSLYLDMARAGVWGRDAFVNKTNDVASYYWNGLDDGPGKFPHHAWWQIGWITDYLISEVELRSAGDITFPAGFIAPKVGPHKTYGFRPGKVYGEQARLIMKQGLITLDNPYIDYMVAKNEAGNKVYVMLLNNSDKQQQFDLHLKADKLKNKGKDGLKNISIRFLKSNTTSNKENMKEHRTITIEPFGLATMEVSL